MCQVTSMRRDIGIISRDTWTEWRGQQVPPERAARVHIVALLTVAVRLPLLGARLINLHLFCQSRAHVGVACAVQRRPTAFWEVVLEVESFEFARMETDPTKRGRHSPTNAGNRKRVPLTVYDAKPTERGLHVADFPHACRREVVAITNVQKIQFCRVVNNHSQARIVEFALT